ncbi:MAG: septation protein IspZ, partial [Rhodobacteraceae bacterium]|nr:septation protein IspZ [Paracoccaceae bacterium]
TFIKMKPTMLYLLFAAILGVGLLRGRSYLALVMEDVLPLRPEGWMILTRRFTAFFACLALLNEVIWRNFSDQVWVDFKTFGLIGLMFLFFMAQAKLLERFALEQKG